MTEQKAQTENLKKSKIWKPNFKRSISKKIAAAVSAALAVTCISLPSAADIPTVSAEAANKISLAVEYMGSGAAPEATGAPSASLREEGEIWLGVSAVSTDDGLKMDDANLALFTKGVYSFEMSFAYDSDYIEPHNGTSGWQEEIEAQNLGANTASSWSSDYEIVAVSDTDINKDAAQTMPLVGTGTNWRMCTVNIRYTGADIENARFYGMSDDGTKQYFLKMPFDVTAVPLSGTAEVIQPVLGPETFDIGSGMYGADYEGEWLDADSGTEYTNLKNVFAPSGNILLFTEGATISNIDVKKVKYTPNAEDPETNDESFDESADMYHDKTQDGAYGFRVEQKEYYVSVENEVDKVRILITAGAAVTVNSSPASSYIGEGANYYADIPLETLDAADLGASDGYNVVNVNGEYTLYIRRLLKPRIEFKPGNSPYGLIERMSEANGGDWNADKVAAAKTAFDGNGKASKFVAGDNLPDNAKTNITYWSLAWNENESLGDAPSDDVNMDKDPYALFIYQGDALVDPGYKAFDSEGNEIEGAECTTKMTVNIMSRANATYMGAAVAATIASDGSGEYGFDALSATVESQKIYIRPDVYKLEYTVSDPVTGENITASRNVVVLWDLGDVDMTLVINPSDATNLNKMLQGSYTPLNGVEGVPRCLYFYRICDFDNTGAVNSSDATNSSKYLRGAYESIERFYPYITADGNISWTK